MAKEPYVSALAIDADSGKRLFEENADAVAYPASIVKLMVLLLILERVEQGALTLDEMVQVTEEAARMGGSQVYLDPKEQFPVRDLLYALIIQSANDAAVALAMHVAGSKDGFVALMNEKAEALGMKDTRFHSVHGLPPSEGQKPDRSTARDLALLSRELARRPEVFTFTGSRVRPFRNGEFIMRTHNHLLADVEGADGLKTGYFRAAGFSIIATAKRNGVRIIAIVLGSKDRKVRDAKATELLTKGFAAVPPRPAVDTSVSGAETARAPEVGPTSAAADEPPAPAAEDEAPVRVPRGWYMFFFGFGAGFLFCLILGMFRSGSRRRKHHRIG